MKMREQLGGYWSHICDTKNILCIAVAPHGSVFSGFVEAAPYDVGKGSMTVIAGSTDNGTTWIGGGGCGGKAYSFRGHSVMTSGGWATADGEFNYTWFSFDDGLTWKDIPQPCPQPPFTWCSNGNILFSRGGLALSSDTGASSTKISDSTASALLALPQGGVLVGTDATGIYLLSDNGDSIKSLNEGLTDLHVHSFALDGNGYVYVGTLDGIWRRPLSQVVSVGPSHNVPSAFQLEQNYPNPFNPSTTIRFEIPTSAAVRLSVLDILGREVEVLVNERMNAGAHEKVFNAAGLASGVYFYQLKTGQYCETKKLTLVR
jgi:hypothetical protein